MDLSSITAPGSEEEEVVEGAVPTEEAASAAPEFISVMEEAIPESATIACYEIGVASATDTVEEEDDC